MPFWKRAFDIAFSVAAMPLLAVCAALMTVIHEIVSPGPVFFTQERIGYRGGSFRIYKFRTMAANADPTVHQAYFSELVSSHAPMAKLDAKGDTRLIPGAWLLRASGFDELPQLINVLRGEMSLVGPRPCLPSEFAEYLPEQRARFEAMPGLTGLWQVSGKNRTTFEEMVRLDIEYARTRSPWLDAKIIVLTIPVAVLQVRDTRGGRGSTPRPLGPKETILPS